MAALDFPDTPTTGQTYDKWMWDGAVWALSAGSTGSGPRMIAWANTSSDSGPYTAYADIPGLSVTWIADPTRTYQIMSYTTLSSSVANDVAAVAMANASNTVLMADQMNAGLGGANYGFTLQRIETALSGTQTRKLRATRISGTGNVTVQGIYGAMIIVIDLSAT